MLGDIWLDDWLGIIASWFPQDSYLNSPAAMHGLLAIILVGLICGSVGSLVVGNRMAFFSDALAHCAFAGVGLALVIALLTQAGPTEIVPWILPILIAFGSLIGLGIAFVREKTSLANDTVIGVFFAGAIGFGAVMLKWSSARAYVNPENFLFGELVFTSGRDLVNLLILLPIVLGFMIWMNNWLVFASFNPSLALSRRIPVRLSNYLFIVLLAAIVNVCLHAVGVLLINGFLIVPAATAANLGRNMRQLFWWSVGLSVFIGILGQWFSWQVFVTTNFHPGESGTILVLAVILFFVSMAIAPWIKNRRRRSSATTLTPAMTTPPG